MLLRFYDQDGQSVGDVTETGYWARPLHVGDEVPLDSGTYIVVAILETPQWDAQRNVLFFAFVVKPK